MRINNFFSQNLDIRDLVVRGTKAIRDLPMTERLSSIAKGIIPALGMSFAGIVIQKMTADDKDQHSFLLYGFVATVMTCGVLITSCEAIKRNIQLQLAAALLKTPPHRKTIETVRSPEGSWAAATAKRFV